MPYKDKLKRREHDRATGYAALRKYRQSPKGRATVLRCQANYNASPQGKASNAARTLRYRKSPKGKLALRKQHLARYGITPDEWDALFFQQGNLCAACGASSSGSKFGWQTDHNHRTGCIRGILCHACNVTAGLAKDNPEVLRALAAYLEGHL